MVAILPGGGTGANVVVTGLYLIFLGATMWVASVMYREHRGSLYLLPESRRALLYIAVGVLAVTLTATHRLWATPAGSVAWLVLIGASVYAGVRRRLGRPALLSALGFRGVGLPSASASGELDG